MILKKMTPNIDLIVTTFNDISRIKKCLDSIEKQNYNTKVFIVDDGSTDGTIDYIKKNHPDFNIKVIGKGPSENRNFAIEKTKGDYIITMDSDAKLISEDWIKQAIEFMQKNPKTGICGGKLLLSDHKLGAAGGMMTKRGNGWDYGHGNNPNKKEYNILKNVIYVSTATAILRRKMIKEIGIFDETYGHGFEDTDLGFRANVAGWDVIYNPELLSYHYKDYLKSGKSTLNKKTNFYLKKNKLTTILKNYQLKTIIFYSPILFLNFLYNMIFQENRISTLKAYLWNLKNYKRILKQRKFINTIRKTPDKELFKKIKFGF